MWSFVAQKLLLGIIATYIKLNVYSLSSRVTSRDCPSTVFNKHTINI